jgi:endonuclease/exonuclease/phosphatase family metal-dependent hydrolase
MLKFIQLFLLILSLTTNCIAQDISVMTYNVRYGLADDGENSWNFRKEFLTSQINFYNPDFLGIQEGLPFQLFYIDSLMPQHHYIGKSRDKDGKGEYSAILYNYKKFDLLEQHTFWLSPTPLKPSKGWDAAYPRICTYGLFKSKKTAKKIWVFNTHLDHIGKKAREESVHLIVKKIAHANTDNYPLILMGDFNAEPESNPITYIKTKLNDSKEISIVKPFGPDGTFNAFQFNKPVTRRIDYIFISKNNNIKVNKYAVLSDSKELKYPSDHLPVFVELTLPKENN